MFFIVCFFKIRTSIGCYVRIAFGVEFGMPAVIHNKIMLLLYIILKGAFVPSGADVPVRFP